LRLFLGLYRLCAGVERQRDRITHKRKKGKSGKAKSPPEK
jgi:hypothetical protein